MAGWSVQRYDPIRERPWMGSFVGDGFELASLIKEVSNRVRCGVCSTQGEG